MTSAGQGASEQARRAALSAVWYRAQAEAAERQQRAWAAGAAGERLVAEALAPLEAEGWVLFHDVRWPGRSRANLDHVAVGPGGVVVVDTKNWSGDVNVRDGVLRVGSWRKDRELDAVASATSAVAALLPPHRRPLVRGALCLVQQDLTACSTSSGIAVVGRDSLITLLRNLPTALPPVEVTDTVDQLRRRLREQAVTHEARTSTTPRHAGPSRTARPQRRRRRERSPGGAVVENLLRIGFALVVAWFAVTQLPELASSMLIPRTP